MELEPRLSLPPSILPGGDVWLSQQTTPQPSRKRRPRPERLRATVKGSNAGQGFGFVGRGGGGDVFVRFSSVQMGGFRKLEAGQSAQFNVEAGTKGQQAYNVVPL